MIMEANPQPWAAAVVTIMVGLGGFIVVLRGQSKATTAMADVHRMVNSTATRMQVALGIACTCIAVLVWFGISEAGRRLPKGK